MQYVTHTAPLSQPDDKPMNSAPALESPGYLGIESVHDDTTPDTHRVSQAHNQLLVPASVLWYDLFVC